MEILGQNSSLPRHSGAKRRRFADFHPKKVDFLNFLHKTLSKQKMRKPSCQEREGFFILTLKVVNYG